MLEQCPFGVQPATQNEAFRIGVCWMRKSFPRNYLLSNQCIHFECCKNGHGLSFVLSCPIYLEFCHCFTDAQWALNVIHNAKWVIISKFNIFFSKVILLFSISSSSLHNVFFLVFHIMVYCTLCIHIETKNYDLYAAVVLNIQNYRKVYISQFSIECKSENANNKTMAHSFHENRKFFSKNGEMES